ncbi:hypothetical protein EDB92DRAFT_2084426 [Lactarius akahatsu]|uniref:Crinkler (CRN) family protein n=1 Tax=Lactarius akahatsu TaxID=416441 RepID=A0AAD4LLX3_9AGAM|nr:hypothetical protein EDB92DRAFT_2084426 [Lactarius akahatsu]
MATTHFRVYVPFLDILCSFRRNMDMSCIGDLLEVIWGKEGGRLTGQKVGFSQLSLRPLVSHLKNQHSNSHFYCPQVNPVSLEPRDTLQKRVAYSARVTELADKADTDPVPPGWWDLENLHVYLYVHFGPEVQAAEQLYKTLWGEELKVILKEISDDNGTTWKYVPETRIGSLRMLGYTVPCLLLRPEYDITFNTFNEDHRTAKRRECGGVVATGQPGIGKTCFLYYALLRRLSEMKPVALERPGFFILFHEGGVYRYSNTDPDSLPERTWALSDSNENAPQPCSAFGTVSKRRTAWVIQTTSPAEKRWKNWKKYCTADMFVMNPISIEEVTVLGKLLKPEVDVSDLQRIYRKWGPSARTCLQLLQDGEERLHERMVTKTAGDFVTDPLPITKYNESKVSHLLFSIRPENQSRIGRKAQVPEMATDHIKAIISYAAADAEARDQINFFEKISTHPDFKVPAGKMFEGFVLSWLYARQNVEPLSCFATGQAVLEIPACGKKQTTFFGSKATLTEGNQPPFCLLPTAQNFATADAIVITDEFVITIQVTVSDKHDAKKRGFDKIKELIPTPLKRDKWRHVFITDSDKKAVSLRNQFLPDLPQNALVYSGVFDILWSGVTREHVEAFFNEKNSQPTSQQPPCGNSMEVDGV